MPPSAEGVARGARVVCAVLGASDSGGPDSGAVARPSGGVRVRGRVSGPVVARAVWGRFWGVSEAGPVVTVDPVIGVRVWGVAHLRGRGFRLGKK